MCLVRGNEDCGSFPPFPRFHFPTAGFALMGSFGASTPTGRMKCLQEVMSFTSFTIISPKSAPYAGVLAVVEASALCWVPCGLRGWMA